jgi:cystathionine beta-synthase
MLCNNILEAIGKTPLVKLNRVTSHLECTVWAKCEFLNPGGSIKDRIGYRMVLDAEKSGRIKPGDTLIEPTSGNTGIGIALAGATKGYRVIITMPEKMSREKQVVLEALGAEIIRTPTAAAWDDPDSHIMVARRLQRELPNAHILDQYSNPSNPAVHYETTAEEILADLGGKVDMVVMGAGTGGTVTGVAKRLKEVNPKTIIVGADPVGSILGGGTTVGSYKVEGIGYDFIPDVLDRSLVDTWVKTNDQQSFVLARRLMREEGLLCGGSCGSALFAALQEAPRLKKGQNCVVILPDGVRNYMTKFVDDKWMMDNQFKSHDGLRGTVGDLASTKNARKLTSMEHTAHTRSAIELMRREGISQIPITDDGKLAGLLTEEAILQHLAAGPIAENSRVYAVMNRSVPSVEHTTPIGALQEILMRYGSAVVIDQTRRPTQILTKIDLVEWMARS